MDRPLTPLETQIAHELPNTNGAIARRLNKPPSNTLRSLKKLVEEGIIEKDEEKIYHWKAFKPLPARMDPGVPKEEEQWIKTSRTLMNYYKERTTKALEGKDTEQMMEMLNSTDTQYEVALYIEIITKLEEENKKQEEESK